MDFREAEQIALGTLDWPQMIAVPPERVVSGHPEASTVSIVEAAGIQMGLWKVTPGVFSTDHAGYIEFIHILDGVGRLVSETGEVTDLNAGVTTVTPIGWRGHWEIDDTLTKVFTILQGEDADFTIH